MNQGEAIAIDGRANRWTPLRVLLVLLGAVLGGILLSVITGGLAAHAADDPDAPSTSLVGSVAASVDDHIVAPVEQHVLPAAAPATTRVDAVIAPVISEATAGAAAPLPPGTGTSAVSRIDGILDRSPLAATPVWSTLIGPHPVGTLLAPVGAIVHDALPGLAPTLVPVLGTAASNPQLGMPVVAANLGVAAHAVVAAATSAVSGVAAGLLPGTPGPLPLPALAVSAGGLSPVVPASVLGMFMMLFLALAKARRDDGSLPSSPVYETDSSPD